MKRNFLIGLIAILIVATIVYAQTVNKQIYGVATPGLYRYVLSTDTQDSYLFSVPTLSSADTMVGLAATQTLTNKTLTSPTITSPTITGTTSIGNGATLTTPVIASFYQDAGKTKLMTTPNTASDTLAAIAATQTFTNKTLTTPVVTNPDVSFAVSSNVFQAGEDWTLSATELKSLLLSVSSGSGTPSIIAPTTSGKMYILRNASNIAVTLKQSGGTGVSIASGKTAVLINNGSDYVRVTADATH